MDKSLQRQQAQRAALAKRGMQAPVARVGVSAKPAERLYPDLTRGGAIPKHSPKWNNQQVVRSDGRSDFVYSDWRNW